VTLTARTSIPGCAFGFPGRADHKPDKPGRVLPPRGACWSTHHDNHPARISLPEKAAGIVRVSAPIAHRITSHQRDPEVRPSGFPPAPGFSFSLPRCFERRKARVGTAQTREDGGPGVSSGRNGVQSDEHGAQTVWSDPVRSWSEERACSIWPNHNRLSVGRRPTRRRVWGSGLRIEDLTRFARNPGALNSSPAAGVFAGLDVHRAAGRRAGRSPRRETMKRLPLIVENLVTNTFPWR